MYAEHSSAICARFAWIKTEMIEYEKWERRKTSIILRFPDAHTMKELIFIDSVSIRFVPFGSSAFINRRNIELIL